MYAGVWKLLMSVEVKVVRVVITPSPRVIRTASTARLGFSYCCLHLLSTQKSQGKSVEGLISTSRERMRLAHRRQEEGQNDFCRASCTFPRAGGWRVGKGGVVPSSMN